MVLQIFVRKDFDPAGVMLLDPAKVRVVTLGSEEFLELETARRGKKRLYYTAKAGDTLAKLGRRYGLTPGDLARINRFSYNTELHEGDRIVVYSPTGDAPHEHTMGMTPGKKRPERGTTAAAAARADAGRGREEEAGDRGRQGATQSRPPRRTRQVAGQVRQARQGRRTRSPTRRRQDRRQEEVAGVRHGARAHPARSGRAASRSRRRRRPSPG